MHSTRQNGIDTKVNLSFLRSVCDGDEEFITSIIQTFVEDAPKILQRLVEHTEQANWIKAGLAAHQLKPSLQFIGLNETLAYIQTIEHCSKENYDTAAIPKLVSKVALSISQAVEELQHYLNQPDELP